MWPMARSEMREGEGEEVSEVKEGTREKLDGWVVFFDSEGAAGLGEG